MAIANTSLQEEIQKVLDAGPTESNFVWSCQLHTPQEDIEPMRLLSMDFIRDYADAEGDDVRVEIALKRGELNHRVIPYKQNLQMTLQRKPTVETTGRADVDREISVFRMRALLLTEGDPTIETNTEELSDERVSDHTGMVRAKFQLLNLSLEQLRLKTTGAPFRKMVPAKALRFLMGKMAKSIDVPDPARIRGIDLVPPDNTKPRNHIFIPHGTKVMELPSWVQRHGGGIYNSGIGFYIQGQFWYVFPEFALNRFSKTPKTLTVINVPEDKYPGLDRTYMKESGKLIVLSTSKVTFKDDSEKLQLNEGNGVRYVNSDTSFEGLVSVADNKAVMTKSDRAAEYFIQRREDEQQAAFFSPERMTSNHQYQASLLARRKGSHLVVDWEHSDMELLYPGMPARFMYHRENEVKTLEGALISAHTYIYSNEKGPKVKKHNSVTRMVLFVAKPELRSPEEK